MMLRYTFTINLTQGKQALIDERDWYRLREQKWYARKRSDRKGFYAVREVKASGRRFQVFMSTSSSTVAWMPSTT